MQSTLTRQRPQDTQSILDILEGRKNLPHNLSRQTHSQTETLNQSQRNSSLDSYHPPSQKISTGTKFANRLMGAVGFFAGLYTLYIGAMAFFTSSLLLGIVMLFLGWFFIFISENLWKA